MAVTELKPGAAASQGKLSPALQALTAAALVLPGLTARAADGDHVDFQYGHYEEEERQLSTLFIDPSGRFRKTKLSNLNPIEVDSLHGSGQVTLADRVKFAFNYTQDTWSGATPVATAPVAFGMNNPLVNRDGTVVTGASPYLQSVSFGGAAFDAQLNPLRLNPDFGSYSVDKQLVHTLATASPETRKQGDFKLSYEWDEAAADLGGGISVENDYESRFVNLGGRLDFNQKLTTLNLGLSYTNSDTQAHLDHDASPYLDVTAFSRQIDGNLAEGLELLGTRQDWAVNLGLTQVINKDALVQTAVGYTRSTGYLSNPYKVVKAFFVDPDPDASGMPGVFFAADDKAFLEQRPEVRNQWFWNAHYVQHVNPLDAALHLDYRFYHDDWGIDAHTFEAAWAQPVGHRWTITPRVRYYSQDEADFFHPFLAVMGASGSSEENLARLPDHFSSDHRLSGYGALSGGITVSTQFVKGINFEAGFEYYTHAGDLKLGGGGEGSYADFNYYVANAALKVNLSALGSGGDGYEHHHHHNHRGGPEPAGVMFGHMMTQAGGIMVGYRYMYSRQDGDMLHGANGASDPEIRSNGCPGTAGCRTAPKFMNMHMHMLDLMYAPTDWLNLMLMPQFVDMEMNQRLLDGVVPDATIDHLHGHTTGGVGDTGLYALVKLVDLPGHEFHLGLGVTAPTGDVDIKLRTMHQNDGGFIHYGMQLGSGTWDFKPSLTYTGHLEDWSWGAQLSGVKRLEGENESGFAFGDAFQSTAWGSYSLLNWLSLSVRGVYTLQDPVRHRFDPTPGRRAGANAADVNPQAGPMDFPGSYGGHYWDVGFGVSAEVPAGSFRGNRLGVEWLQPIQDDVNGYQLEREGALSATWSIAF